MIVERITLMAIYQYLKQLQSNEGRVYDIVISQKIAKGIKSPEVFKSIDELLRYVQTRYPWVPEFKQAEVCTWNPYSVLKFWVEKDNGTLVEFKRSEVEIKKDSIYDISKKRLRELNDYLKKVASQTKKLKIEYYISPTTQSFVECVYVDDLVKNAAYYFIADEYAKYIKP